MKFKHINYYTLTISTLFIGLALSSCSKKSDSVVTPPKTTDTTKVTPFVYNYALQADTLQTFTYGTFKSADGNYFIQNNSGTTTFNYWPQAHMLDVLTDGYLRTKAAFILSA